MNAAAEALMADNMDADVAHVALTATGAVVWATKIAPTVVK